MPALFLVGIAQGDGFLPGLSKSKLAVDEEVDSNRAEVWNLLFYFLPFS